MVRMSLRWNGRRTSGSPTPRPSGTRQYASTQAILRSPLVNRLPRLAACLHRLANAGSGLALGPHAVRGDAELGPNPTQGGSRLTLFLLEQLPELAVSGVIQREPGQLL